LARPAMMEAENTLFPAIAAAGVADAARYVST
jgi:hypothetical protein